MCWKGRIGYFTMRKLNSGVPFITKRRIQMGSRPSVARELVMSPMSIMDFQPKSRARAVTCCLAGASLPQMKRS